QRKISVEKRRANALRINEASFSVTSVVYTGDAMGTANLTAIKDRIAELTVVPEPKHKTAAARSGRHRQRRRQTKNAVTTTVATPPAVPPAVPPARSRTSIARGLALLSALGLAGVLQHCRAHQHLPWFILACHRDGKCVRGRQIVGCGAAWAAPYRLATAQT